MKITMNKTQLKTFNLLGKTLKYLQSYDQKTSEIETYVLRVMAYTLKDRNPILNKNDKDNPNMIKLFNLIKKLKEDK